MKVKIVSELEKNEKIDKNLLKYMTIKVKEFDLKTNYFSTKEKDEVAKKEVQWLKKEIATKKADKAILLD